MTNETTQIPLAGNIDTNSIVQVPIVGDKPTQSGHAGVLTWVAVSVAVVAAVAWAGKKLKANAAAFEKTAEDELLDDILEAIAKDAPDRAVLRAELAAAISGDGALRSGPLADILRIEESFEKQSTGRYLQRISILRRKTGTTAALTKIEREIGWEYIPEAIREQFIKTRETKVVRLVYDSEKGPGA